MNVLNVVRDVSVILLAIEVFIMGLIPLAILGALVYGVWRLRRHQNLPTWLRTARSYLMVGKHYVERAMGIAARPVLVGHSASAGLRAWVRALGGSARDDEASVLKRETLV